MVVRELVVRLGLNVDESGFRKADASIDQLVSHAKHALAAWGVVKIAEFLKHQFEQLAEAGDHLNRLAQKTGIGTEALQELGYAAKMADVDAGELQMGLVHLARAAHEAATTGGAAAAAFQQLGIQVTQDKVKDLGGLFREVADKMRAMQDGGVKAALAVELFSRSGANLIPMLNEGSAGLEKAAKEAHHFGTMSDRLVQSSVRLDDAIKHLKASLWGLSISVFGPYVDRVRRAVDAVAEFIAKHREWIGLRIHTAFELALRLLAPFVDLVEFAVGGLRQLAEVTIGLKRALVGLGVAALMALSPFTAQLLFLLVILEDIYSYFQGKDSFTKDLVDGLKAIDWSDLWASLKLGAEEFFTWVEARARQAIESIPRSWLDGMFGAPPRPQPGQQVFMGSAPPATFGQGFSNFLKHVDPWPWYLEPTPLGPYPLATVAGLQSSAPAFTANITVHAGAGADGDEIGVTLEEKLDEWAGGLFRDLAIIGRRY